MPVPISHDRFDSWISTLNPTCASVMCRLPPKFAGQAAFVDVAGLLLFPQWRL